MFDGLQEGSLWMVSMSTILAVLPLIKLFHHIFHSNRSYKVQSLEAFSKVLIGNGNISNRLVAEQLFINQFKIHIDYETIVVLLNFSSPTNAINLYRNSKKYLHVDRGQLVYKGKYQCTKKRRLEKYVRPFRNYALYWIFAMVSGLTGLYVYRSFDINTILHFNYILFNGAIWTLSSIASCVSLILAVKCLTDTTNIKDAEALIDLGNQYKSTQRWYY
ncbi:hypothetical protein DLR69_15310 [Vibrio paracholerae]|uniref:Uncharacterized protein n=1 Tax=Vibrio paracholerae TaxID=650003 RepID=A0AAX1QNU3_9VIBR|nr:MULTISPECIES: hypothetical protein [Vibrio]MBY3674268.1 hypothetical protein [Vibrio cholerae]RBM52074.1 hypothetical protein DLR69_15310 [Vibrio paracholerae]RBM73804.1 hypothetical protein DLR70_17745 [Vibrio paracholerae]